MNKEAAPIARRDHPAENGSPEAEAEISIHSAEDR
jgi:hypothetical protein